jgi:Transport protein particle (TRAPP) component
MVQYHQNRVDSISELERRLESTGFSVGLRVLELLAYRSREYKRETKLMNILQFVSTVVWKSLFSKPADSLERSIDHADEFMIVDYTPITRYVRTMLLELQICASNFRTFRVLPLKWMPFSSLVVYLCLKQSVSDPASLWSIDHVAISFFPFASHSTFVSVPADFGGLSVDSYISGIIAGILEGAGFPARVTAHSVALEDGEAAPVNVANGVPAAAGVYGLPPRKEKTVFLVKFAQSVLTRDSQIN